MNIGFIGFGEVGYEMSKGLMNEQNHNIYVYDPLYDREDVIQRSIEANVTLFDNPIDVVVQSLEILFVAVPSKFAKDAWDSIKSYINDKTYYVDLTTASAETKKNISIEFLNLNAKSFIDGAIMGPLKGNQHKVPINLSGHSLDSFVTLAKELNMNVSVVSKTVGDATNIKFIRSIYTKGLSTLLHEVMEMAELLELDEVILNSLIATMDKEPFEIIMNRLITGNVLHAERRVSEMENVIDLIRSYNKEPLMTMATRNKLSAIANKNLAEKLDKEEAKDWKLVIEKFNRV